MPYTAGQAREVVTHMVNAARANGGKFDIHDGDTGAVVATITAYDLPKRPKDMPRHLRPKYKLSKRQRQQARHEKLGVRVVA